MTGDNASVGLFMYDTTLARSQSINSLGDIAIRRGNTPIDIGANRNGSGRIRALWDEVVVGNGVQIRCAISTSNNEPLVPATSTIPLPGGGTTPAAFWSWHFGSLDPVNFQAFVTSVSLTRASVSFSSDGGQSFTSNINITNTIPNRANWNPGADGGQLLTSVGDGTNYVLLQYEINIIPTPGAIALVCSGLWTMVHRKRR